MQVTGSSIVKYRDVERSWVSGYDLAGERYEFTYPHGYDRPLNLQEVREFLECPHTPTDPAAWLSPVERERRVLTREVLSRASMQASS